jgi:hypothetical protein
LTGLKFNEKKATHLLESRGQVLSAKKKNREAQHPSLPGEPRTGAISRLEV